MNAARQQVYNIHQRIWHWLQAAGIGGLLLSGAAIHWPALVAGLPFAWMIVLHDTLGILLSVHAFLGLFYYATTGAIRRFLPEPNHFFARASHVADYYLRGIFRGDPHPELQDPERPLNPLQQVTYLALLNILLPLQIGTGLLIFGRNSWVGSLDWLGGLPVLAAIHTLGAWLFAAFLVMHVYLTTTGPRPLDYLKTMVFGDSGIDPNDETARSEASLPTATQRPTKPVYQAASEA